MLNINLKKKSIKSFLIITRLFPESGSEKVEIFGSIVQFSSASSRTIVPITHFLRILIILLIIELYYYHIIVYLFIYPILLDQIPELIFALTSRIYAVKPSVNLLRHAFPKTRLACSINIMILVISSPSFFN
jgi:hypothetical protein